MNYSQIAAGRRQVSLHRPPPPFFLGNQQFEIKFGYRVVYLSVTKTCSPFQQNQRRQTLVMVYNSSTSLSVLSFKVVAHQASPQYLQPQGALHILPR